MNEVSNGPSGNQEYVELVVVSNTVSYSCNSSTPPCIDIRGWIFDDNSGYHGASGVAGGAVRFSQNSLWACVPLGTIILIYNNSDRNPAIPPDDISMADGNCRIIAPINNTTLFESNSTTPGASACSYPASGWTPGGTWNNTLLANPGDCARIVNLSGCEVFSVCWGSDNTNNLIYFSGAGGQKVWYFNGNNPSVQANWTSGSAASTPGSQTPGAANNAVNASYISQFNNGCMPITPINVTTSQVNAGCTCNGSATANATGSIGPYTYVWYNSTFTPIGQTSVTATGLCAGVYNVIATSHIGCSDTIAVTITSTSTSSVAVNSPTICSGASAVLTATPSATGGNYLWTPGGQTSQTISVNPSTTATYSVTYTLAGCSGNAISTVSVNPPPTITVNSSTICTGQTATLTANGATSYTWNTGSTVNPLTVIPVTLTDYTVTGSSNGCTNTATTSVTVNPSPTITVSSVMVCTGQATTLTANGAATYTWSTGSTANPLTVSPATTGNYTVTGTLAGCTNTAIATLTVNPSPTITVNSQSICIGQTATLTANGASTYTWNTGSTVNPLTDNPSTTTSYTVTGTQAGCTNSAVVILTVNPSPAITVNSATVCEGQTASLTANGATSYTWNTGSTTNPLTVSPSALTDYTVIGTLAGCTNTVVATVSVNPSPTITVNSVTICAGQTATLTANGAATYTWSTGSTVNPFTDNPASTTVHTVTGTQAGCSNTATATINVSPSPSITVSSQSICIGQTATLTANGASTYTWSTGSTINPLTDNPSTTTSYTVTGMQAGCSNTAIATLSVNPTPTITVSSSTICAGQTATLTANGAASYSWSTGSSDNSLTVSPAVTTNYTVTGSLSGCTNTAVTTLSVNPSPTITVNSATLCAGQTAILTVNGAATYSWNTGSTANPFTDNPASTTIYTVTGTQAGCSNTATASIDVTSSPTITVSSQSICVGQTASLTANGAATYTWNTGSTFNPLSDNPSFTTSYTVTGTQAGCTNTAVAIISVNPIPTITVSSATVCAGQTATLTANGAASYSWSTGSTGNLLTVSPSATSNYTVTGNVNGCSDTLTTFVIVITPPALITNSPSICAGQNATVNVNGANSYTWSTGATTSSLTVSPITTTAYTVTGTTGICTSTAHVTITVNALPVLAVTDQTICAGATTTIHVSGAANYLWSNGSVSDQLFVSPLVSEAYTVTGSNGGCADSSVVKITVKPIPIVNFSADTTSGCAPLCVSFTDLTNSTDAINLWNWNFGDGGTSGLTDPQHCYTTPGIYDIRLTVTTIAGCNANYTSPAMIRVFQFPTAAFTSNAENADLFDPTVYFVNQSTGAVTYNWDFGDLVLSDQSDPSHTYNQEGVYTTTLIAISQNGCRDTTRREIKIKGIFTFYAPNTFTPNNDMKNDVFLPVGTGWDPDTYSLRIFDRWGNNCFSTKDANLGWNGKSNGGSEVSQIDTYTWMVELKDVFNKEHNFTGRVTILK